ncbi:DMT family transporter [Aquisalimonas lutea]|uniref:DMT family transporter n=1 Tax=Aquisalimonas lutea TaxID=1327750 RepID=UPI0025B3C88D|nr:DMT family transporter [Aquisalimonas lutea]MDN3517734.1 DMT family transporter [Aquisalimonas lutea]
MANETKATLLALGAVLLWSTVASAFKLSLNYLTPVQLLAWASLVSLVTLGVLLAATGQLRALRATRPADAAYSLALGVCNPFLYYVVLFEAYDRLPAQEAQPLNYTWAFTLALLSIPLLRQRLSRWDVIGGVIAYGGVWTIATRGQVLAVEFANPAGVALALGSTVLWALYWIGSTRDHRPPLVALFSNFAAAAPVVVIACALTDGMAITQWQGLAGAAYVGMFEMGLAFALWLSAMRLTRSAARIGNLIFLSPFLSLVFIRILVGEAIMASTVVGLALIVAGLVLQQTLRRA